MIRRFAEVAAVAYFLGEVCGTVACAAHAQQPQPTRYYSLPDAARDTDVFCVTVRHGMRCIVIGEMRTWFGALQVAP